MRMLRWLLLGCCVSFANLLAEAGSSNSLMDISADGKLLACSNRDSGTVTIVELPALKKLREIKVGHHPEGVSFIGSTHRLATAVYDDDVVVFADADSGEVTHRVDVFDEPYGVVSNNAGSRLYVTLEFPGRVVEIDTGRVAVIREMEAGSFPRGIAITPKDDRLVVSEYLTAKVLSIDVQSGRQVDEWAGGETDNLARQVVIHPSRPKAYIPHIRARVTIPQGEGSIFPYVGTVDLDHKQETRRKRIPMDAFIGALVTANPWEVAITPDGKRFFVVFAGTNDMFACQTVDDDYREITPLRLMRLGNNPRAVRVSPDSSRFYVYNALDFNVVAYDVASLSQIKDVTVCDNPLSEDVHLGKVLFYTALQPMVGRRWISCSSCHPDGQADGRTWHNPDGLRATPPLGGLAFTHPQHWSADRDETQDFEHTIRGPLMQGTGLIRGRLNDSLGKPNKGLSKSLDALAAYTNSHRFTMSPYAKNGLSDSAKRGRELFLNETIGCAKCHSGPFYTDSQSGKPSQMHDIGTGRGDKSEKMGTKYDTPTLLSLYRTAPYLHDASAATLMDVLRSQNPNDQHGKTSHLKDGQLEDLVEFLKALPYEDPEPAAEQAGIKRIAG